MSACPCGICAAGQTCVTYQNGDQQSAICTALSAGGQPPSLNGWSPISTSTCTDTPTSYMDNWFWIVGILVLGIVAFMAYYLLRK